MKKIICIILTLGITAICIADQSEQATFNPAGEWKRDNKGWIFAFSNDGTWKALKTGDTGTWEIENQTITMIWKGPNVPNPRRTFKIIDNNTFKGNNAPFGDTTYTRLKP